jgi:hypothetical protein
MRVQQPLLTDDKIKCIADETVNATNKVFSHGLNLKEKQEAIKYYVKTTKDIYSLIPNGSSFIEIILDSLSRLFRRSFYSTSGLTTFGNRIASQLSGSIKKDEKSLENLPVRPKLS